MCIIDWMFVNGYLLGLWFFLCLGCYLEFGVGVG